MSIKEKYKPIEEKETRQRLAAQQQIDVQSRINKQNKLREISLEEEAKRIRKAKIREIFNKSGIRGLMDEVAQIKHGHVFTENDDSQTKIISRWMVNRETRESVNWHSLTGLIGSTKVDFLEITAQINQEGITIAGLTPEVLSGTKMYDRDKLEDAIVKALANPGPPPEEWHPSFYGQGF